MALTPTYARATGYFGIPGSSKGRFTVHATFNGRPLCGWKPTKKHEFQWCAWGYHWPYLECETCKRTVRGILQAEKRAV